MAAASCAKSYFKCLKSLKNVLEVADKARVKICVYSLLFLLSFTAWAKPNLAGLGAYENHGAVCDRLFSEVLAQAKPRAGYDKLQRLKKRFAEFHGIDENDNKKFIERAILANRGEVTDAKLYLDIESAVLKELNDNVIQDRELVTVLTNLHKDVVWKAIAEDPVLSAALLDKYSDFKSLRFAFKNDSPEIRARASALLSNVNKKYSEYLADLSQERGWADRVKGISADVRNWYHGGLGVAPDQAGLATRYSRNNLGPAGIAVLRAFKDAAPELQMAAFNAGKLQKWAAKHFESVEGFLVSAKSGRKVPSAEAIEAIKKASAQAGVSQTQAVARTLSARFKIRVGSKEAAALEQYVNLANSFSPGLLQAKREVIDMTVPAKGVISADFKGQNARNLEETMRALADTEGLHLIAHIRAVREGEIAATIALDNKKVHFQKAIDAFLNELQQKKIISAADRRKIKSQFTGDDGTTFVPFSLTPEIRETAQKHLLENMNAEDARVAFVPFEKKGSAVTAEARSEWIVAAESVEKKLREQLVGKIDREELNSLQIAVYFEPNATGDWITVLHLGKNGGRVSQESAGIILELAKSLGFRARLIGNL
jgi:hypothetical protein